MEGCQHHLDAGDRSVLAALVRRDDANVTSLWMVARKLAGTTRGSTILLVTLVALISGFVQFGAAAARRTDSSFDRFVAWSQPPTLSTGGINDDSQIPLGDRLPSLNSLPGVEDWTRNEAVNAGWIELTPGARTYPPRLNVGAIGSAPLDPGHGRMKILAGRLPAADSTREVITDYPTADTFGLDVGDEFTIVMSQHVNDGEPRIDTPWPVRLVGIVSIPGTFPTIAGYSFASLLFPQGFVEQHPEWIDPWGASENIWLTEGVDGVDRFVSGMSDLGLGGLDIQVNATNYAGANKVVRLQAIGLWLAAGSGGHGLDRDRPAADARTPASGTSCTSVGRSG